MNSHALICTGTDCCSARVLASILHQYGLFPILCSENNPPVNSISKPCALFVSYAWLSKQPDVCSIFSDILNSQSPVLVFDIPESQQRLPALELINCNTSSSIIQSSSIQWSLNPFCKSLSGLATDLAEKSVVFDADIPGWEELIYIDNHPILLKKKDLNSSVFLLSGIPLSSISAKVNTDEAEQNTLTILSPLILFIQNCIPENIWKSQKTLGCFILDDPSLQDKYGYFELNSLREIIEYSGSASIAFIPWYYAKSNPGCARVIQQNHPQLSICVHGCDHTWNEFVEDDMLATYSLIAESLRRMDHHRIKYNIDYEPVIVFPQGRFSQTTLEALATSKFIGAINSTLFSFGDNDAIDLSELVSPIHTQQGFPLLKRYYPEDEIGYAFALLLGRPVVFTEHHAFFKKGYQKLSALFNQSDVDRWTSPANIFREFYQARQNSDGDTEVRFFSKDFVYKCTKNSKRIHFQTPVLAQSVQNVFINEKIVSYKVNHDTINFSFAGDAVEPLYIKIVGSYLPDFPEYHKSEFEKIRILIRRKASEFRDNVICKSSFVEGLYSMIRKRLKKKH